MNALKDFKWFFLLILIVGIVWIFTGGPEKESSNNPFIRPPSPIDSGKTYGFSFFGSKNIWATNDPNSEEEGEKPLSDELEKIQEEAKQIQKELEKIEEKTNESKYSGVVSLKKGSRSGDVDREYIQVNLSKSAESKVVITGWEIKSIVTGTSVKIGEASWLPRMGAVNKKNTIVLSPGEKVIINTGRSPIGVSFRTNLCTGYFSQFQKFYPSLDRDCPKPEDEIPEEYASGPNRFNDLCLDFIERISRCSINTREIDEYMQPQCRTFITRDINYNACVDRHNNEDRFFGDEWRVYLDRSNKIWKSKREIIKLFDEEGKTVDVISY